MTLTRSAKWTSLALIAVGFAVLVWVFTTPSGLRFLLNQLDPVSVTQVHGNAFTATLEGVDIQVGATHASAESLNYVWQPLRLLQGDLVLTKLMSQGVSITLEREAKTDQKSKAGIELPVDIIVDKLLITDIEVQRDDARTSLDEVSSRFRIKSNQLDLDELLIRHTQAMLEVQGAMDLSGSGLIDLQNSLDFKLSEDEREGQVLGRIAGSWENLKVDQNATLAIETGGIADLSLVGTLINLGSGQPRVDLAGGWRIPATNLNLGDSESGLSPLINGTYRLNGDLETAELSIQSDFPSSEEVAATQLIGDLALSLNKRSVQLNRLEVEDASGQVSASIVGKIIATESPEWDIEVSLNNFSPGQLVPLDTTLPESLTGVLSSRGQVSESSRNGVGLIGHLRSQKLSGAWAGHPLTAKLEMELGEDVLILQAIDLSLSGSRLTVVGTASPDLIKLNYDLVGSDLTVLSESLAGELTAQGEIGGSWERPTLAGKLRGVGLSGQSREGERFSVDELNASVEFGLGDVNSPLGIEVYVSNLYSGTHEFAKDLEFEIQGVLGEHVISAKAESERLRLAQLGLRGGLQVEDWQGPQTYLWSGSLQELILSSQDFGDWSLESPTLVLASQKKASVQPLCMRAEEQSVCFTWGLVDGVSRGELEITDLAANLLASAIEPSLPPLQGRLNGTVEVSGNLEQGLTASADIEGADWRLPLPELGNQDQSGNQDEQWLDVETFRVQLENQDSLSLLFDVVVDEYHFAKARLQGSAVDSVDALLKQALQGDAQIAWQDLSRSPINPLTGIRLAGSLDGRLQINGSLIDPRIALRAEVSDGSADLNVAGLALRDINMVAVSRDATALELNGDPRSGDGALEIVGKLDFADLQKPSAKLHLKGDGITLMQTSDIAAVGNVDLTTHLVNELVDVQGSIAIQSADLSFGPRENVVAVSPDVVLLGAENDNRGAKQRLNLNVNLGENTRLTAAGLSAALKGSLEIKQRAGEILTGVGQVEIADGRYQAYGQSLSIDRGYLIFNGTSLDDPQLDFRATKTANSYTAGVSVSGRAQAPVINLYSTPTVSDQDVLSILVFGKPISELSADDSLTLLRIASSIQTGQPDRITRLTNNLQETLGLSDLQFRLLDDAPEIIAGKQLTSRFYVGYGYGLLDAAQSLVLKYKINDAWSVQGDFGDDSGADLRYQLER